MDINIAPEAPLSGVDVYALPPAEGEAVLRRQLAAAYRLVDYFGWTELIYGHLTARVPGEQPHFLINPFGLNYDEVTASNLVKIDCDGNMVEPSAHPVNYAGFVIHSAVHMVHAERNRAVMHTHTRAGMAVSALKEGLLPISMMSTAFHGKLSYHDYEGVSLDTDERGRLLKDLGDNQAMMLRNHGLLTTGRSVAEAFQRLYRLERACQIQLDAGAAGTLNILGDNVARKSGADLDGYADEKCAVDSMADLEFAALIRKLDKIDASWRH
ncbi:MAG TPA: class II aldolase/adducin family protein [Reyranella sp.]|nr:class II aldolase/adducin family protein [Reyranella sp.]